MTKKRTPVVTKTLPCCPHCTECGGLIKQSGAYHTSEHLELGQLIKRFRVCCKFCNQFSILREVSEFPPKSSDSDSQQPQ